MTSLMSGPASPRTRRTHRTRTALTAGLAAFALLGLSACSEEPAQDATDIVADAQAQDYRDDQAESQRVREAYRQLPQPTSGTVRISGNRGSLTPDEVFAFNQSGTSTDVSMTYDGEDAAFAALCSGEIDIVDSSREVTRAEFEACRRVGLDLVQFQVASDAVVVATKNESDVGGDCLSTDQVREIYRAGSPVTRWSQLGDGFGQAPARLDRGLNRDPKRPEDDQPEAHRDQHEEPHADPAVLALGVVDVRLGHVSTQVDCQVDDTSCGDRNSHRNASEFAIESGDHESNCFRCAG